ncbi:hypothetical protein SISSUDRAFT_1072038 [Sistotremastrum suecicum HHB10207 ss-3]|uniref:F-box domain-containing protein n=1 Tax=Sistotremastrum suecicum HHB10207 ss-3 TaxID=1314776 RepID=A0A165ZXB2_9AGAM|nr:hypothetical protein SISSUDRAFT_1072038 [Sistotremastrum suecicum HHB10207 ss-3]
MARLLDLPVEVLPLILTHILKSHHLTLICLVSHTFLYYARPLLYKRIFIYAWHRQGKTKVIQLFTTLARKPELAALVGVLEMRDFPKALSIEEQDRLMDLCITGLENCINLRSCTWTRDGSLTTPLLKALLSSSTLQEFSLNGHYEGHYDPTLLLQFSRLQKLTIIMPSSDIISLLPAWLGACTETLKSLSLICKASPRLTDEILSSAAESLSSLQRLHLAGCTKITHKGILAVMRVNPSLVSLGLEGLSPTFDMEELSGHCTSHNLTSLLRSLTLTMPSSGNIDKWFNQVLSLVKESPLEEFQIYTVGGDLVTGRALSEDFVARLVGAHSHRLRKFAVQRLRTSMQVIGMICQNCPMLEQLYVVVEDRNWGALGQCLSTASNLRMLHINFPPDTLGEDERPILSESEMLFIAQHCGPRLVQFGASTRVRLVERTAFRDGDGEIHTGMKLVPYESPEIPEQFLVQQA